MDWKLGVIVFCSAFIVIYFATSYVHHMSYEYGWPKSEVISMTLFLPFAFILSFIFSLISSPMNAYFICKSVIKEHDAKLRIKRGDA